ncbi:class II glutamine amidotransferase domain-containing protein [Verminephrobacter eiseniae]|uniref:amidophosphoribosyltransferase n=1 Tax=Verminephrobacter eiseniae TaxID=364317 RepID=UPI0010E375EE|nr:amidophosphoribosyltransferase [Verminephrobacter eiseniae]KAB7598071.1 amidophosphoribosyltransferase [Verminephrobacter sp. Larva24]MCW5230802.1 amidophosphoribosyltransferase [Verminephrobacter eiseniae]MCW5292535.1 amidophosphoribosyltransferase [Verminephrobacter eiseniae]MCW8187092.1 amidophosphoribosyltransferase [Verminephrobacter eiseniae]MCW8223509.1 amidophosphoribosyltransferase [Verminephrobacter eiseniae]
MCGIVGLLVKTPALREQLGQLMVPMMIGMTERGPDSAGLAVFTPPLAGARKKISVFAGDIDGGEHYDWQALVDALNHDRAASASATGRGRHASVAFEADPEIIGNWIKGYQPLLKLFCVGKSIDVYKDIGTPAQVASRYGFAHFKGSHLVGHTRMATESAVTPDRAHPFTAGEDFCLVHNGSLSNPNGIRRMLAPHGIAFDTDNDTEAATRFLQWRLREGDTLEDALRKGLAVLDGFYTFLMGTPTELALIRDPFACKPAVVAETDDYVAIASEFRSLAHLPGIGQAHVFEPAPEEMYVWKA